MQYQESVRSSFQYQPSLIMACRTKGGLVKLTKSSCLELCKKSIRDNLSMIPRFKENNNIIRRYCTEVAFCFLSIIGAFSKAQDPKDKNHQSSSKSNQHCHGIKQQTRFKVFRMKMPQPCNLKLTKNKSFWQNIYTAFHCTAAEKTSLELYIINQGPNSYTD